MIFIFDTETTGLPKAIGTNLTIQPRCIEIYGGVYARNGDLIDEFEDMYNPGFPLPKQIVAITGITDNALRNKPEYKVEDLDLFNQYLKQCTTVVAHNLSFDEAIMDFEAQRLGGNNYVSWPAEHVCTVEQTMHIKGRRMKLTELYLHLFDKPYEQTHRAKDDVDALAKCYFELIKRKEI